MGKRKGFFIVLWCLILAAVLAVLSMKETLIVEIGIVAYRSLRIVLFFLLALLTAVILISLIRAGIREGKQKSRKRKEETGAAAEAEKKTDARLSVRKKLDESDMRSLLLRHSQGNWQRLSGEITTCLNQMDRMDEYQERLSSLLSMNGVESLRDTEDMLDAVEQYTFRNIRKVINYMNVLDPDDASDRDKAKDQLDSCIRDNKERLNQVQDFLLSLADFLNKQGEGSQEIDMLQMYRDTILSSLQEHSF